LLPGQVVARDVVDAFKQRMRAQADAVGDPVHRASGHGASVDDIAQHADRRVGFTVGLERGAELPPFAREHHESGEESDDRDQQERTDESEYVTGACE